jgi:hypothetical protein
MQAELEKWITDHTEHSEIRDSCGDLLGYYEVVDADDLRAFLAEYVLCNAEPVAWQYQVNYTYCNVSWVLPPDDSYDEGTLRPLYAPASPLGNASLAGNADISPQGEAGKEGA